MTPLVFWALVLFFSLTALAWFSDRAVDTAAALAILLDMSPLIVGVGLVSIGTSLPEIATSIVSAARGSGDIIVGDSIGSSLAQLTLVMGLSVIFAGKVGADKKDVTLFGGSMLLATILGVLAVQSAEISRSMGLLLVASYFVLALFVRKYALHEYYLPKIHKEHHMHLGKLFFFLTGTVVASWGAVDAAINISDIVGLPEFIIAFFLISLGTSLPELAIRVSAIKKGHHAIAVGDIFGSNIADMTLSMGIGPLFFPVKVTAFLATAPGWYLIFASALVVYLFASTREIDLPFAVLLVFLYLFSFVVTGAVLVLPGEAFVQYF